MLELKDLTLHLPGDEEDLILAEEITARLPANGHFAAVLGPSGCGKSTLLKLIAGLREPTAGQVAWEGRDLAVEGDLAPHEIGYVPQFSVAYDALTVWESLETASRLRVAGISSEERDAALRHILEEAGLTEIADRRVGVLSGGQRRRLALALELVVSPRVLLCDEVTSGLDPKAEDEIANLLHRLSREPGRLVMSVTHSLRHLSLCDSVLVLHQGRLAYHGPPDFMYHYFGVEKHEDLFPSLARRQSESWHRSWQKHREAYYSQAQWTAEVGSSAPPPEAPLLTPTADEEPIKPVAVVIEPEPAAPETPVDKPARAELIAPNVVQQLFVLLVRRWRLFARDRGQLVLHLALLFGFPCLVVIFALEGLPQLKSLASPVSGGFLQEVQNEFAQQAERMRTGSLVSGLIMFQVILLALMGSNNASREVAGERLIFEKEKFAGLRPSAYVLSKAFFLGALVVLQAGWMAVFVNWIVRFPGSLLEQAGLLLCIDAALTSVCLAFSALLSSPEQASLVSVYLVGFQLPLSGAVLALPSWLSGFARPFIASYWGWSGFIQTLRDTRFYEAIHSVSTTALSPEPLCFWILACHILAGFLAAYFGCRRARWE